MGANTVYKKQNYLSDSEIESCCNTNTSLLQLFTKYKNADGFLTSNELERITLKLLHRTHIKKLIQITASLNHKLSFNDFKYLYALFITNNTKAKINFILDFMFIKSKQLSKVIYIKKSKKYFHPNQSLMSILIEGVDSEHGNNDKINRNQVFDFLIQQHYNFFDSFSFLKPINDKGLNYDKLLQLKDNQPMLNKANESFNDLERQYSLAHLITPIQCRQYDILEKEFHCIEKHNNGIFSIETLEMMLTEVNVNRGLIVIISKFIRKKTHKFFINFELFKTLLSLLTSDNKEEGLYNIFAYPDQVIKKKSFVAFIKVIKPELSSKDANAILNQYHIEDIVSKDKFNYLIPLVINEVKSSFEHVKYLQYIFFKVKCPDKMTEKNCIDILLQKKSLEKYISDKASNNEDSFYVIDYAFWKSWIEYISDISYPQTTNRKNLRISTQTISDKNGKITEGLVYLKDYAVLTAKLYELFTFWFGLSLGPELKRSKIYINTNNSSKKKLKNNCVWYDNIPSPITGIELITNKRYEIEIFPVFLLFFNFEDLQKKNSSFLTIKDDLKLLTNSTNINGRYYPFSRQLMFSDILKVLEESIKESLDQNKTRLWIYYQGVFNQVPFEKKLEEEGISGMAIIVIEKQSNSFWPSDKFKTDIQCIKKKNSALSIGLINIGNTCYLNSVLQTFLNNTDLKHLFLNESMRSFLTNNQRECNLLFEFINLLKEKWIEQKRAIVPKKFKEICGKYNETFKDYDQQDAHDFFTFLVDNLHEDTNLKIETVKITKSEINDDINNCCLLSNEHWANQIQNNASYIHGLFLGQLKSTLICKSCNSENITYEAFSSISLPIPEDTKIVIEIILFRLPFTAKPYYDKLADNNGDNFNKKIKEIKASNLRSSLKNIRFNSINICDDEDNSSTVSNKNPGRNNNISKENNDKKNITGDVLRTFFFDKGANCQTLKSTNNKLSSSLSTNIPIKIRIAINRKDNCSTILEKIKELHDLELEPNSEHTQLIIINNGKFVEEELIIDECFINGQKVVVYELMKWKGINKVFDYKSPPSSEINSNDNTNNNKSCFALDKNLINAMINYNCIIKSNEISLSVNKEVLMPILHRYCSANIPLEYFVLPYGFEYKNIDTYQDYIVLTTINSIQPIHLYEFIWEKYEYFFKHPTKLENSLWWKQIAIGNSNHYTTNMQDNPKPFVLKLVNKFNTACAFCPWYTFCRGCVIDPFNTQFLSFSFNQILIIEWNRAVYLKEVTKENQMLILNHPSLKITEMHNQNYKNTISILDCFNLFTEKEEIHDIRCSTCSKKTKFEKKLELDYLPKYLVLALKRFKYTKMYRKKIDSLIKFPFENLDLSQFICNSNRGSNSLYSLYAVVNHSGTLTEGHYSTAIRFEEGNWIKYDDSITYDAEDNIETNAAYMLIYKRHHNNNPNHLVLDYFGLLNTAYKLFNHESDFINMFNYSIDPNDSSKIKKLEGISLFYYGEPVCTDYGLGFIMNIYQYGNTGVYLIKVKLKRGYAIIKYNSSKSIKSTIKEDFKSKMLKNSAHGKETLNPTEGTIITIQKRKGGGICNQCIIF